MDNITHLASVNRLYRKNEEQQSRFTFHYLYDEQHRNQGTQEIYYYPSDTIHVAQAQDYSLYTHQAQASYNYERNGTRSFFRNLLEAHGTWGAQSGEPTWQSGTDTESANEQPSANQPIESLDHSQANYLRLSLFLPLYLPPHYTSICASQPVARAATGLYG